MLFTGCGREGTKIVLTTGFSEGEVFRIETMSCSLAEIMVYLTNTQNQYESVYGEEIWNTDFEGITLEKNVKDTVLARIARIKVLNLLAEKKEVTLTDAEKQFAKDAAGEYFKSLSKAEIDRIGLSQELLETMYKEYALANKVYDNIIKDINPEISDDEARTITVAHILIKTVTENGKGELLPYSTEGKEEAYSKAEQALQRAKNGEDFDLLMEEYNEDDANTISFSHGEVAKEMEDVSFNLATDEISGIVETEYGYEIIKCISTFNKEETDANKIKIVEKRKKEVFNAEYEEFVKTLTKKLNESLWEEVVLIHEDDVDTIDFFTIYETYFTK